MNRHLLIADMNGLCKCYKHGYLWREGADFKKGRRPKYGPGGACKKCVLKTEL
jgi:hypothetical protein